jgi:hypothetical protein
MVRINTSFAILSSALAYAGYCNAQDYNSEFDELIQREPGLFSILKKVPIVGNIFGRSVVPPLAKVTSHDLPAVDSGRY